MRVEDFRLLYQYNRWANARVLDSVAALPGERFTEDVSGSFRSVRDTLTHILAAEWIWLKRWKGTSPPALLDPVEFPDVAAFKARWAEVEAEQADFVEGVTEEALQEVIAYVNMKGETWRYPLWQMMQHLVNHSSYHRGQVATLLRQLQASPVSTDFLLFFDLEGGGAGAKG